MDRAINVLDALTALQQRHPHAADPRLLRWGLGAGASCILFAFLRTIVSTAQDSLATHVANSIDENWRVIGAVFLTVTILWVLVVCYLIHTKFPSLRNNIYGCLDSILCFVLQGQESAPQEILPWRIVEQGHSPTAWQLTTPPANSLPRHAARPLLQQPPRGTKCLGVKAKVGPDDDPSCGNRPMNRDSEDAEQRLFCRYHLRQASAHRDSVQLPNWPPALRQAVAGGNQGPLIRRSSRIRAIKTEEPE